MTKIILRRSRSDWIDTSFLLWLSAWRDSAFGRNWKCSYATMIISCMAYWLGTWINGFHPLCFECCKNVLINVNAMAVKDAQLDIISYFLMTLQQISSGTFIKQQVHGMLLDFFFSPLKFFRLVSFPCSLCPALSRQRSFVLFPYSIRLRYYHHHRRHFFVDNIGIPQAYAHMSRTRVIWLFVFGKINNGWWHAQRRHNHHRTSRHTKRTCH